MRFRACVPTLVLLLVTVSAPHAQRPTDRLVVADYLEWEQVQAPAFSPDGQQIVFTRRWIDKLNDRWQSSLWIMGADGSRPRVSSQLYLRDWFKKHARTTTAAVSEGGTRR